jgi:hypothetical protein
LTYPSEKYELVSWDYYSQHISKKMFQTTNQVTIVLTASDPLINGKDPSDIAMALGPHSRRRLKDLGQIESGKAV